MNVRTTISLSATSYEIKTTPIQLAITEFVEKKAILVLFSELEGAESDDAVAYVFSAAS